jgi:cation diffusion facilitator family transporter
MEVKIQEHYRRIRKVLIIVLALNWLVALAKIIYGLLSRCASITADGFHSLSDGASNIIGLIGISFASQPKDKDHPYGHKKYETFFSLGIAALLFLVAFQLIEEAVRRFYKPVIPQIDLRSFLVMLLTLIINLAVMRYEQKKGKFLQSDILVSDSLHTRSDIFISLSVIAGLVAIESGYPIIDPIITIAISLFIGLAGYEIVKEASHILCDSAVILDLKTVMDIVLGIPGVKTCHKIRTRGRPDDVHIDLHVQVNPDMHMDEAHRISYAIENAIKKRLPQASDVIVHMEPKEKE